MVQPAPTEVGRQNHIDPRKRLIWRRDQTIAQLNAGPLRPLMQPTLHFQHLAGLLFIREIIPLCPESQTIVGALEGVRFIVLLCEGSCH